MSTNIDERLEEAEKTVDAELEAEITKSDDAYDDRIEANEQKEQDIHNQIGVQDENGNWNEGSWADTQTDIQNEQTEFTIDQIELQKDRAESDYIKEQSGAYKDWQKQSDPYGVNAEQRAAQGLTNTGYSESSQVSMYNTYQNRVATARESFQRAIVDYDNAIAQARLANNAALAEIAAQALAQRMEATLQFVQINNALLSEKTNAQLTLKSMYQDKWKAMLDKILQEAALAQDQAQFDATMAENRRQFDILHPAETGGGGSGGISRSALIDAGFTPNDKKDKTYATIDGKPETTSDEKDLPVDTASLVACGLAGASAEKINAEIAAGRLLEQVVDGKLTYRRVYANGAIIGSSKTVPTTTYKPESEKNKTIFDKIGDKFTEWFK